MKIKFCKDCKNYNGFASCYRNAIESRDFVSGKKILINVLSCNTDRRDTYDFSCGPSGKFFRKK
jgi:hypothetical protein